ncbi:MAG: methylenetetrahydrofolate reductase C-terminal domain-containing protein [Deltaproteobacteria bacterium]|nr:methylenetetrahydrofolate reductase C-terminal domain-containing protein [Deltaproteobacteria bacterium]
MIVAEHKPIRELLALVEGCDKILMAGCKGCVSVCNAGGQKEVAILASALRIARKKAGRPIEITELTLDRQCEPEFIEWLEEPIKKSGAQAVMSLACSIGPQYIAEAYPGLMVVPGLNTTFMGGTEKHGIWAEYCSSCGNCGLVNFGGLCPVTRCAKGLLNGPCGGSVDGTCEANPDTPCIWDMIYERLKGLGQLDRLEKAIGPKDWSTSLSGGPRKIVREDLTL